ncbi:S-adenosylmethionine-dependent methyltransferase Rv2258c-like isoform X2 [Littorina saxatilis]|uniref:Methyltransferase domain-containing protein n=2 Tax=Littorina saxatilis TaxID=31220 RepID=A0AAN9BQP0_9CAEN
MSSYEELTRDVYTWGSVSLALAMAHETGITPILCQAQGPLSSHQLAQQGKLKERYVREVVNALAVAGLVQLEEWTGGEDGVEARYLVPDTHRHALKAAGTFCGLVSTCARQFSGVKECFDVDGPSCVRYENSMFNALDELGVLRANNITTAILKTPGIKQLLDDGIEVAEVGCGTGRLAHHLAAMFPKSHFTVTDVVEQPLQLARQRAEGERLTNMTFHLLDVCKVPYAWTEKFDWMFAFDVIHDLPYPLEAIKGVFKALKPGGHFSMVDELVSSFVAENKNNMAAARLYALGTFLCIPESYQQPDSEALGPCWGEEKARDLLGKAGFHVLGLTRSGTEDMGPMAVCMCQKTC